MNVKYLLQRLIHSPTRKIIAIMCAFGLWFFVAIDNDYQYTRAVKVVYENTPESLIIVDSVPSITVTFTGRGSALLSTWAAPPTARCPLDAGIVGTNEIPVKRIHTAIRLGDAVVTYNVSALAITLDRKMTKELPVIVPIKGTTNENYSISTITVADTVTVTGPLQLLHNVAEISTESLNVRNRAQSFSRKLKLESISHLISYSTREVLVRVSIDSTVEKTFTNVPVRIVLGPGQRTPSSILSLDTLIVSGSKNLIANLEKKDINVRIRVTHLPQGEHSLAATIILPDYIKPVHSNPKKFAITIY